ncbi:MAG: hypothetical protein IKR48_01410 [Kiritimatiellae bacterium]|nr:hypothetical protein [Kiritimatiellia bacterium]
MNSMNTHRKPGGNITVVLSTVLSFLCKSITIGLVMILGISVDALTDDGEKQSPPPIQDSFLRDTEPSANFGSSSGNTHITLHTSTYSGNDWNFGIISPERAQGISCASQIVFTFTNWV